MDATKENVKKYKRLLLNGIASEKSLTADDKKFLKTYEVGFQRAVMALLEDRPLSGSLKYRIKKFAHGKRSSYSERYANHDFLATVLKTIKQRIVSSVMVLKKLPSNDDLLFLSLLICVCAPNDRRYNFNDDDVPIFSGFAKNISLVKAELEHLRLLDLFPEFYGFEKKIETVKISRRGDSLDFKF